MLASSKISRRSLALMFALALLLTLPSVSNSASRERYEGRLLVGTRGETSVDFFIERKAGQRHKALFRVEGLPMGCEDGTVKRYTTVRLQLRFYTPRRFSLGIEPSTGIINGYSLLLIEGKISKDGRSAKGEVFYEQNFYSDPATPDCASDATEWKARLKS